MKMSIKKNCDSSFDSCFPFSPAAVQLRKLVAADEIPDTAHACLAVIYSDAPTGMTAIFEITTLEPALKWNKLAVI